MEVKEIKEVNKLSDLISQGRIQAKEAVALIGNFIKKNKPLFKLNKYDEDFTSEIILSFLEKGEKIISNYKCNSSDFFTYIYYQIKSFIYTRRKLMAIQNIKDNIAFGEGIYNLEDKLNLYDNLNKSYRYTAARRNYIKKDKDYIRSILNKIDSDKYDKKILVLAIKSSFYITDSQVKKVCNFYDLKTEDFYDVIQYCKDSIEKKTYKRQKAQERRNFAYYHQKRYESQLETFRNTEKEFDAVAKNQILSKKQKHYRSWSNLNKKFEDGFLFLRPTNKTVAELLGICERQVSYYINCAKKDYEKAQKTENKED